MNENTTKLIEQLAQKLGTTSEYLWGVLLKQAPIDATINLIQIIIVLLFGWILYKIYKKIIKNTDSTNSYYSKYEEATSVPMAMGLLVFAILLIYAFSCIGDVINGYFNPEYWALDRIINAWD